MSKVADKIMTCLYGGDELRDLLGHEPDGIIVKDMEDVFGKKGYAALFAEIAYQIRQEESEMRGFCKRVEDATKNEEELDLFGVAYTPLPTDAEGVPVRVGDMLQGEHCCDGWCEPFKVDRISLGRYGWTAHEKNGTGHIVDRCRHYKPQTVEDVLCEFALACKDEGNSCPDVARIAAEYAAKLQLREEG
jgi:hypothetical protein